MTYTWLIFFSKAHDIFTDDGKKAEDGSISKDAAREGGSKDDPLQINIVNSSISELDEFASKREELKPMKKAERKKKGGAAVRQLGVYVPPAKRSNSQEEADKRCVTIHIT